MTVAGDGNAVGVSSPEQSGRAALYCWHGLDTLECGTTLLLSALLRKVMAVSSR